MNRAHAVVASFKSHGVDDISKGLLAKNCGIAHWPALKTCNRLATSTTDYINNRVGIYRESIRSDRDVRISSVPGIRK
jgi:hypothetical protein